MLPVSGWLWCEQALLFKSTVQQSITALGMIDPARASTEAAIMGDLAKVSQLEQQAVLKKVGQFPRFTAMMLECQHDEQGMRIQKECDIAKKVGAIALKRLVAKAAKNHCQKTTDELEKLREINTQLLHDNMELRGRWRGAVVAVAVAAAGKAKKYTSY